MPSPIEEGSPERAPFESYVARAVSAATTLIVAYLAFKLRSPLFAALAVAIGRGVFLRPDFASAGAWWGYLAAYPFSAYLFLSNYRSPPREPDDWIWLAATACVAALLINHLAGRFRRVWSFTRDPLFIAGRR